MKRHLIFGTVTLLLALVAGVGGYWLGFLYGSRWGLMADGLPRGVVAVGNLHLLERGHPDSVRFYLETEVDSGLMDWDQLERFPLRSAFNTLYGDNVIPGYEGYVRKLAAYRKEHPSPLDDPSLTQQTIQHIREQDPAMAQEMQEGDSLRRQRIQELLKKYGQ